MSGSPLADFRQHRPVVDVARRQPPQLQQPVTPLVGAPVVALVAAQHPQAQLRLLRRPQHHQRAEAHLRHPRVRPTRT